MSITADGRDAYRERDIDATRRMARAFEQARSTTSSRRRHGVLLFNTSPGGVPQCFVAALSFDGFDPVESLKRSHVLLVYADEPRALQAAHDLTRLAADEPTGSDAASIVITRLHPDGRTAR